MPSRSCRRNSHRYPRLVLGANVQTETAPTTPAPISAHDCRLIDLPKIHDPRGNLTFIESGKHVPFEIERAFWIYDVPGRGGLTIQTLGAGQVLGWSWLVPPYNWRFDGRAAEVTRAIVFDGKCLRGKCEEDHELGYELQKRVISILGEHLDATRFRLLDVYRDAIE